MAASTILSLREGLEAALIIGIVLGVLRKMQRPDLRISVWAGAGSAAVISTLAAVALDRVGAEFEGRAEEIFEGVAMFLAAAVLTWMVFWMHRQARNLKADIELNVRQASLNGGRLAIFILAFLAVMREGIELALFLQAARLASDPTQQLAGAMVGLAGAVLLGWILFTGTSRLDLGRFFRITNVILGLFAAGMVGLGIHEFNELGWIPAIVDPIWNTSAILADTSPFGQVLKSLVGYSSTPSLTQAIGYAGYVFLVGMISLPRWKMIRPEEPARANQI